MVFRSCLMVLALAAVSHAQTFELRDSLDGPWEKPEAVFDPEFWGEGFDEDWFVSKVPWVGDQQFWLYAEPILKTDGEYSQAANAYIGEGNPRDLWLARYIEGAPAGTTFNVSLDYRFDLGDPGDFSNFILVDIRDGDHRSTEGVGDIESYPGHERPETINVDPSTFGTGQFHTFEMEHTTAPDADGFTLLMIIRFVTVTDVEQDNWLFLDNLIVTATEETGVDMWSLY